jgi:hypothetical protein
MSDRPDPKLAAADFLFSLLDDIDTASDMAKGNDKAYRSMVERIQRRRFEVASTDGYVVKFHEKADA